MKIRIGKLIFKKFLQQNVNKQEENEFIHSYFMKNNRTSIEAFI